MSRLPGPIGLVSPRYAPAIGGVERHVERLARGLAARGMEVEVITTDPTAQLPPVEERDGVLVRRFPTVGGDSVFFVAPSLGAWLLRQAGRFALLHAHSYHTPLAFQAAMAAWRANRPLVLTPHYHGTGHSPLRRALHLPYRPIGGWVVRRAGRVICVSRAERELLAGHFGPDIPAVVVPNGIEVPAQEHPQPRTAEYRWVLAVGRLETYKQIERLAAALPSLPADHHLVVIGDGPARPAIERAAARAGARDRLHLLGRVSDSELQGWYRSAAAFVSLSRHEAFGLTLLEAAAAGASIVASRIPAHEEVAGCLPPDQVTFIEHDCRTAELAQAIRQAVSTGRAEPGRWRLPTWESAVEGVLACYGEVLTEASLAADHAAA